MIIGQSLVAPDADIVGGPVTYLGPWMARKSDAATFLLEVQYVSSSGCSIEAFVEHKNSEQADSSAAIAATFATITAPGTYPVGATGLKEWVRYRYDLSGTSSADEWVHMRANTPVWQPN
jgi:hypothetical protein